MDCCVRHLAAAEVEMRIVDPTPILTREKRLDLTDTSIPGDIMVAGWHRRRAASRRQQRRKRGNTSGDEMKVHASFVKNGWKRGTIIFSKTMGDRPLNRITGTTKQAICCQLGGGFIC